ncbi:MAG: glycosyltransferase family 2 protein [Rhodobacterales bacterium]|nr:glycosyltransferase family 2 protein [Rhodobacterales bacterium]
MASWGLVATVKTSEEKVLAFVAHHLSLGADHIWIYFDDPEDPAHAALSAHPRVTTTLCDADYWRGKKRHDRHQNRQSRNARDAYEKCSTDWLGHIDVDEFILPDRPLCDILQDMPTEQLVVKLEPFEAMHDPLLPDDIYTSREFRGAIRHEHWRFRRRALGDYRKVIRDGLLSHSVGKVLFRKGIPNLSPRLHSVMLDGIRLPARDWCAEARLLHFHAQDRQAWVDALPFRLARGAYQYQATMQEHLSKSTAAEIDDFYLTTQVLSLDVARGLQEVGRVITVDLRLREKVRALRMGALDQGVARPGPRVD